MGLVQLSSRHEPAENLPQTLELIEQAAGLGADLVITPEMTDFYEPTLDRVRQKASPHEEHPVLLAASDLAATLEIWLLIGSVNVDVGGGVANRSVLMDSRGQAAGIYDKIHLYDVDIPDGQVYRESSIYRPGNKALVVDLPWGKAGLSICYDLRFPDLYRGLALQGAVFLTVPAAFTRLTGSAHWETLLRTRAIENGCFVFAAAQCGTHAGGRQTYGHSMAVDPWGHVLIEAGTDVGVVVTDIDVGRVSEVRQMIPSLSAGRSASYDFTTPVS